MLNNIKNKNILFIGAGGGYDILSSIPLWVELRMSNNIFFANYNTTQSNLTDLVNAEDTFTFPESKFVEHLRINYRDELVYAIPKYGVKPIVKFVKSLVERHKIDLIIAVDGGVDSLMQGNEINSGTLLEDSAVLTALNQIEVEKYLICFGFGTETEEDLSHFHVLENIASLIKLNGFIGSFALTKDKESYKIYKDMCEYVWKDQKESHIHTKIISAIEGNFGNNNIYKNVDPRLVNDSKKCFISCLMSFFWIFKLEEVVKLNKVSKYLLNTTTKTDLVVAYRQFLNTTPPTKPKEIIPL